MYLCVCVCVCRWALRSVSITLVVCFFVPRACVCSLFSFSFFVSLWPLVCGFGPARVVFFSSWQLSCLIGLASLSLSCSFWLLFCVFGQPFSCLFGLVSLSLSCFAAVVRFGLSPWVLVLGPLRVAFPSSS